MSSSWNGEFTLTVFGQSHADAIGVTVDGLPAGHKLDMDALQAFLSRRAPGRSEWATTRSEADCPEILCGISDGYTCGAPLTAIIRNSDTRPRDYENLRDMPRPGHADYTAGMKYGGYQDATGGGHFSGRLTAPLCIAGGICLQLLTEEGITIGAHIAEIAGIPDGCYDPVNVNAETLALAGSRSFPVLEQSAGAAMQQAIAQAKAEQDSVGGIVECGAVGIPAGLGDPMLDGMENRIARLVFAIPAVKGVEFGAGFGAARLRGSENNDPFRMQDGKVRTATNYAGGILGGITDGMPLVFRAAFKPTPSIGKEQDTVSLTRRENEKLTVRGRYDPCIVPRAVPCVEAAAAIAVYDALLTAKKQKR